MLPTKIGVQLGQAAIELSHLKPEQRQALVDELISKGYTKLRDLPVGDAAEKAGEIVGTIAMEAILAKGVSTAGKVTLEGLETLKGTKFAAQITELAQATKTAIAETKIPTKLAVVQEAEVFGDTGLPKIVGTEHKTLGEVFQNLEARAQQVLSGGEKAKAINLPAWEKLTFKVDAGETKPHFLTGHQEGGSRLMQSQKAGGRKDVFPSTMTDNQIINSIKSAYKNSKKVGTQVDLLTGEKRVELVGKAAGMEIKMYVNVTTKQLESAFPQWGLK